MIHIGQPAPDFSGITAYQNGSEEFKKISLSDYKEKWLVFFFYPRDFTFVCPTEIRGFAKAEAEFKKLNCSILAASTDSEWSHRNWFLRDLAGVDYPVLADTNHAVCKAPTMWRCWRRMISITKKRVWLNADSLLLIRAAFFNTPLSAPEQSAAA